MTTTLTAPEIQTLMANIGKLTPAEQEQLMAVVEELERRKHAKECRDDLLAFCKHMDPTYIVATHHKKLAELLTQIAYGHKDRIAVSIPPRHGKSHLVSTLFPAWFLGKFPDKKVLMVSHTGDLAVDFGRKVRNIIADSKYTSIFPGISLAQDSKSAGRWSTSRGGEYYACLRRYALVETLRGPIPAGQICIGDQLLNCGKPVKVLEIYNTEHTKTFRVLGLDCSADHPIWTMNRGWVPASEILPGDLLRVASIWDRLKAFVWRSHGYLEYTRVPPLVQHQVPVRESAQRKVSALRRAWDLFMRTLAGIREFPVRYGRGTFTYAHSGTDRQQWTVQPRELPMGDAYRTGEQQTNKHTHWGKNSSSTCQKTRGNTRNNPVQDEQRYGPAQSCKAAKEELRTYGDPEKLGWLSYLSARVIKGCWAGNQPIKSRNWIEGHMESIRRAAENLCGVLLGVRPAGRVGVANTPSSPFVNFLTDGDHTFFADGVLTHNCGVGAALAGRGADLLLVDDPHSEQDLLAGNFDELEKAYQWFTFGARTRLMSGGRIAIVHTRWHQDDLIGHVVKDGANNTKADQYEVFEFPAMLETASGTKALWPEKFDLDALERTKASMPAYQWNAQFMQDPTGEQGALIQRDWWMPWKKDVAPDCEYVIMTLDAAAEKNNRADYTAMLTFGVFVDDVLTKGEPHIILLNAIKIRVEFPELKDLAIREWKEWEPDSFIVEKKSNGTPLYQELRRLGIPVQEFTPHRGTGDKVARINAVADIIRSGMVWYPEGRRWAEDVIEECVAFPFGSNDDQVDCVSMALSRFRQGGFIGLPTDYRDYTPSAARRAAYY